MKFEMARKRLKLLENTFEHENWDSLPQIWGTTTPKSDSAFKNIYFGQRNWAQSTKSDESDLALTV